VNARGVFDALISDPDTDIPLRLEWCNAVKHMYYGDTVVGPTKLFGDVKDDVGGGGKGGKVVKPVKVDEVHNLVEEEVAEPPPVINVDSLAEQGKKARSDQTAKLVTFYRDRIKDPAELKAQLGKVPGLIEK
jgi:hypothetical protein